MPLSALPVSIHYPPLSAFGDAGAAWEEAPTRSRAHDVEAAPAAVAGEGPLALLPPEMKLAIAAQLSGADLASWAASCRREAALLRRHTLGTLALALARWSAGDTEQGPALQMGRHAGGRAWATVLGELGARAIAMPGSMPNHAMADMIGEIRQLEPSLCIRPLLRMLRAVRERAAAYRSVEELDHEALLALVRAIPAAQRAKAMLAYLRAFSDCSTVSYAEWLGMLSDLRCDDRATVLYWSTVAYSEVFGFDGEDVQTGLRCIRAIVDDAGWRKAPEGDSDAGMGESAAAGGADASGARAGSGGRHVARDTASIDPMLAARPGQSLGDALAVLIASACTSSIAMPSGAWATVWEDCLAVTLALPAAFQAPALLSLGRWLRRTERQLSGHPAAALGPALQQRLYAVLLKLPVFVSMSLQAWRATPNGQAPLPPERQTVLALLARLHMLTPPEQAWLLERLAPVFFSNAGEDEPEWRPLRAAAIARLGEAAPAAVRDAALLAWNRAHVQGTGGWDTVVAAQLRALIDGCAAPVRARALDEAARDSLRPAFHFLTDLTRIHALPAHLQARPVQRLARQLARLPAALLPMQRWEDLLHACDGLRSQHRVKPLASLVTALFQLSGWDTNGPQPLSAPPSLRRALDDAMSRLPLALQAHVVAAVARQHSSAEGLGWVVARLPLLAQGQRDCTVPGLPTPPYRAEIVRLLAERMLQFPPASAPPQPPSRIMAVLLGALRTIEPHAWQLPVPAIHALIRMLPAEDRRQAHDELMRCIETLKPAATVGRKRAPPP